MRLTEIDDGIIEIDSDRAASIRFTSDKFMHGSYLYKVGNEIIVSFIASKQKGNFFALVQSILSEGFSVVVATPLPEMRRIAVKNGYQREMRQHEGMGCEVETWVLRPN
ncbi:MAG: hypothetical protein HC771_23825 [Synechococcales cyanobacterium CRU_2_2]|nr:hypothetical protein [Synechococcales cyanobacterium CRU_2_2]